MHTHQHKYNTREAILSTLRRACSQSWRSGSGSSSGGERCTRNRACVCRYTFTSVWARGRATANPECERVQTQHAECVDDKHTHTHKQKCIYSQCNSATFCARRQNVSNWAATHACSICHSMCKYVFSCPYANAWLSDAKTYVAISRLLLQKYPSRIVLTVLQRLPVLHARWSVFAVLSHPLPSLSPAPVCTACVCVCVREEERDTTKAERVCVERMRAKESTRVSENTRAHARESVGERVRERVRKNENARVHKNTRDRGRVSVGLNTHRLLSFMWTNSNTLHHTTVMHHTDTLHNIATHNHIYIHTDICAHQYEYRVAADCKPEIQSPVPLQHTTLQHAATRCNTPYCNTLQHAATHGRLWSRI